MVYLEFVSDDGDMVVYDYMPQREDAPRGTLFVNRSDGQRGLIKKSSADDWSEYRGQAWSLIEEMIKSGNLKEKTGTAWY